MVQENPFDSSAHKRSSTAVLRVWCTKMAIPHLHTASRVVTRGATRCKSQAQSVKSTTSACISRPWLSNQSQAATETRSFNAGFKSTLRCSAGNASRRSVRVTLLRPGDSRSRAATASPASPVPAPSSSTCGCGGNSLSSASNAGVLSQSARTVAASQTAHAVPRPCVHRRASPHVTEAAAGVNGESHLSALLVDE
jgi:hypothetical protein